MNKVKSEFELYEPMRAWLDTYLQDKYRGWRIQTLDAHSKRLDVALKEYGVTNDLAIGIDIQIDVLGIVSNENNTKLFFIEAKKTNLTLRDVGQLWAYCKLIDPEEAFLFTSAELGSLNKIFNIFKRVDLLDFGDGRIIKKMKIAKWNMNTNLPDFSSMVPRI